MLHQDLLSPLVVGPENKVQPQQNISCRCEDETRRDWIQMNGGRKGEVKICNQPICFAGQNDLRFPREYLLELGSRAKQ